MNLDLVKFGFDIMHFAIEATIGVYLYLSNKNTVTNDRITKLEDDFDIKLDSHGDRLSKLEVRIEATPTHDDLSHIHEKINQVSDCVSRLEGEFSGAKHTLDLIHEFLMKGGK